MSRTRSGDGATGDVPADEGEYAEAAEAVGTEAAERLARDTVYRLLSTRARSHAELLRALRRQGIDADTAHAVLDRFVAAGLVDDATFAAEWVRSRHRERGLGRRALEEELRGKGIDGDTVRAALDSVDTDAEVERARQLVRRRARGMTAVEPRTRARRLLAMLARKGYGQALAYRVVREELESSGTSFEELPGDVEPDP
ncbi:regulatory protein RecX [Actinopolyspora mortivallis]|uniref:regulatory protein RecX n=1 Tax=Actinopolyspora mortivallis TaxID=33906 RepID=UPI00037A57DB|nr:regulatory protein RecX [Actinopolyspora mortivallis]